MILVKPSTEIMAVYGEGEGQSKAGPLALIEDAGRTCYKSEDKITKDSASAFVAMIDRRGHHSVLEHSALTVRFVIDRGVSHELVRHRLCAFSQESTRYCNYGGGVTFVIPSWVAIEPGEYNDYANALKSSYMNADGMWFNSLRDQELRYISLLTDGWTPQQARSVLPNSLKTEIVVTANFREWQHIFSLRCGKAAHPQMREVMIPLSQEMHKRIPEVF